MQALHDDLQAQKAELDVLKEDMGRTNLDQSQVEQVLNEAEAKLEDSIAQAPDTEGELECVIEQFGVFNRAVQEWRSWFDPAKADLDLCKDTYRSKASLEERNEKLQVSMK